MKKALDKERKMRWISRMYFGVSHSIDFDINPFEELDSFLKSKIKSLHWGQSKKEAKEKFCNKFLLVLSLYDINIPKEVILKCLENENMNNSETVSRWADEAKFPLNW